MRLGFRREEIDGDILAGAAAVRDSGYQGRMGIYELLILNEGSRRSSLERASADGPVAASASGMRTLRTDGLLKARQGLTSLAEIARVTG